MVDYLDKLPLGYTSFREFIDYSLIYVDKTDLVANLTRSKGPIFLSRPRRFGKSTLVSTFEELFLHGLEKFKGLKIEKQNLWQDKTYKVLHLDFSYIKEDRRLFSFENKFQDSLASAFDSANLPFYKEENVITSFINSIKDLEGSSLVLLIDEYDAPLTAVMGKSEEFEDRRTLLSEFFLTIKRYSGKFRFIFITGVTRYSQVSIFSAFNSLDDISFNPLYGTIVGYTQEELEFYFKDYLEKAAEVLNQKKNTNEFTYEKVLECVKNNYDGYSFDEECSTHVYNPWSILNFLKYPIREFKSYWLDSGASKPSLLVNYFTSVMDKKADRSKLLDFLDEKIKIPVSLDRLSPNIESIEESDSPFEAILYQAGYFTIKEVNNIGTLIGLPNLEVGEAFRKIVLEKLLNKNLEVFSFEYAQEAQEAFDHKDLNKIQDLLNTILNECSYETVPTFKEKHFRDLFKVTIKCLGFKTHTETLLSEGRADLDIEALKYVYVLELKVVNENDPKKIEEKLLEAKAQIKDLKYDKRLDKWLNGREVVGLACVIVNQSKDENHKKPMREVVRLEEVV